ncbi:hypothetical protein MKW98_015047, partial [Papaver atlanticum]
MRSGIRGVLLFLDEGVNEARKANQTSLVTEKKIIEAPQETRGISKQKLMEDRKEKIAKLLDLNGLDMTKACEIHKRLWSQNTKNGKWNLLLFVGM